MSIMREEFYFTPEQRLRFKEIEFDTYRNLNHCCDVKFSGKERELDLIEKNNIALMNCRIQNIRNAIPCCNSGANVTF